MSITERDIDQLKNIIEHKGVCALTKCKCVTCIMQGWCQTWEWNKRHNMDPHTQITSQRCNKARDILIYRRTNNHP